MARRYIIQIVAVVGGFYVGSRALQMLIPYWEARGVVPQLVTVHSYGLAVILGFTAGGLIWAFLQ